MKLGVLTVLYHALAVEEALDELADLGVEAVEFGTGNYPGNAHCDTRRHDQGSSAEEGGYQQRHDHQRAQLSREPASSGRGCRSVGSRCLDEAGSRDKIGRAHV